MVAEKPIKAKPPYFIDFVANYPGYLAFSKKEYSNKTTEKNVPLNQITTIVSSLHAYVDKHLHYELDLSKIDTFLKRVPAAKSEKDYHALVDFYNSPVLKKLVKKATERNASDYEIFLLREWVWIYIARKVFRPAFIQTDYSLRYFSDEAYASEDNVPNFGRELF